MLLVNFLFFFLFFSCHSWSQTDLWQVTTAEPHLLQVMDDHLIDVKINGRLRIVKIKDSLPARYKKFLRKIDGKEKSYLVTKIHEKQNVDEGILKIISKTNKERIFEKVKFLSSFKTRQASSAEIKDAFLSLKKELGLWGYKTQEICYRDNHCSLVATTLNSMSPKSQLVVAHLDSVGKDFAGADDNASGVAVLMEMAFLLSKEKLDKNLIFFISNGEELGLLGAKHLVKHLEGKNELKKIDYVLNMDMVGYNENKIIEIETNAEFESLATELSEVVLMYSNLKPKITLGAWGSDHVPFLDKNVPALLTIEDWSTKTPCYHQACDKPDTLNIEYMNEVAKLNTAMILMRDKK